MARHSVLPYKLISAASTNATIAKAAAAQLLGFDLGNQTASAKFIKFYNSSAEPNVGTDEPVLTIKIPANDRAALILDDSVFFSAGLAFALTANVADSDATPVGAGDVLVNLFFK